MKPEDKITVGMDFGKADMSMVWFDEVAKLPPPSMEFLTTPLVDGVVAVDKSQLEWIANPTVKIKDYVAMADNLGNTMDAMRYAAITGVATMLVGTAPDSAPFGALPDPPALPKGLTEEQRTAHRAIYDLMSIEEFQQEREKPGFIRLNDYWGANGRRKFCCEVATPMGWSAGDSFGQRGHVSWKTYNKAVVLNESWMMKLEETPPGSPWWRRVWDWLLQPTDRPSL